MKKKYKLSDPVVTVNRIKKILGSLGILTHESYVETSNFHSCRITIGNNKIKDLNIGTNGKGSTFEYSLASGYAEFMERLQNNMLLFARRFATEEFFNTGKADKSYIEYLKQEKLLFDFYYDPREVYLSSNEILSLFGQELCELYNYNSLENFKNDLDVRYGDKSFLCVPFFDCQSKKEVFIPIELSLVATGSNGMASGNAPIEALLQGFCEIFERYSLTQIYTHNIVPPTIPHSYFRDSAVQKKLDYLTKVLDYELIIKDCSLGRGLPVIGLIIIDKKTKRYNFKLASDFVEDIALDRCLNELYQGLKNFKSVPFLFYDDNDLDNLRGSRSSHVNLERIFVNGSGYWPLSIFANTYTYTHSPFPATYGLTNEADLKIACELISSFGKNVYIRNNSFLGFPTFYILIPGMSQIVMDRENLIPTYSNPDLSGMIEIGSHNVNLIKEVIEQLENGKNLIELREKSYVRNYPYWTDKDITNLEVSHLLTLLYYFIEDYEKAYSSICIFLENKNIVEYEYFFAVKDFIYLYKIKSLPANQVLSLMELKYNLEMADEIYQDMKDHYKVLDYHNFPAGFNLSNTNFFNNSALFEILRIEKRIHDENLIYSINQDDICELF